MSAPDIAPGALPVPLAEAKDWMRLNSGEDDALVIGFIRSAAGLCEAFTGITLIRREVEEMLPMRSGWQTLARGPVQAITAVRGLPADGAAFDLPVDAYAIDITAAGDGRVRIDNGGAAGRVAVTYVAGMASEAGGVPEALRQGIIRLAAHLQAVRDGGDAHPPAVVSALWRPWRRMRIG